VSINKILTELENKPYLDDLKREYEMMFCPIDAVEQLVEFIDLYWKKGHALVISRELLDWMHLDKVNNRYNYVIARHREKNEIHAILGFVPTSHFDPYIQHPRMWPSMWKKRDDIKVKGLGIGLYHFLVKNIDIESMFMSGLSQVALDFYKSWDFTTGEFSHFVLLNEEVREYKLIDGHTSFRPSPATVSDGYSSIQLCPQSDFETLDPTFFTLIPKHKSKAYYINRFYRHPIYTYNAYVAKSQGRTNAVLFVRECNYEGANALRIVDFIGDLQALIGNSGNLQKLLSERSAEYIDFLHVGLDKHLLEKAGFIDKSKTNFIVPNYFEPFYLKNIGLDYSFKSIYKNEQEAFFKADGDQDRPNLL